MTGGGWWCDQATHLEILDVEASRGPCLGLLLPGWLALSVLSERHRPPSAHHGACRPSARPVNGWRSVAKSSRYDTNTERTICGLGAPRKYNVNTAPRPNTPPIYEDIKQSALDGDPGGTRTELTVDSGGVTSRGMEASMHLRTYGPHVALTLARPAAPPRQTETARKAATRERD